MYSIAKELLNHQETKEMLKVGNIRNMTPLHLACQDGQLEVVKELGSHLTEDDIKRKDKEGNTALHLACEGGEEEIVVLLLEVGKRIEGLINVRNVEGEAPIHFAACYGRKDIVHLLLRNGAKDDERDDHGCTPLHHAARNDQEKMIRFLCER